jgi:hypothetical protein
MVDREELDARAAKLHERIARLVALSLLGEPDDFFDSSEDRKAIYNTAEEIARIWEGLTALDRNQLAKLLVELGEIRDQLYGPRDYEETRRHRAEYRQRLEEEGGNEEEEGDNPSS